MSSNTKSKKGQKTRTPASIVSFEIPANNPGRARKFYGKLFGWKINKFPGMVDYWHINTGGSDDTPDGGMMTRQHPEQTITNYVAVASVDKSAGQVKKLGGKICMGKTAVPGMGYFVLCEDTEKNMFALWEVNGNAK